MKKKGREFGISFGVFSKPIAEQLAVQGLRVNSEEEVQKDATAIARLCMRGFLTSSAGDACRKKLMKRITEQLRPLDKEVQHG